MEGSKRGEDALGEVVGSMMMLTTALVVFLLLGHALLDQARQTAAYIRGLTPDDEAGEPGEDGPLCLVVPGAGRWCQDGAEAGVPCLQDTHGRPWCPQDAHAA